MIADKKLIIVRRNRRTHKTVQYLRKAGFGLFLILLATLVFSYTRAGVYTRTHTRVSAAASSNLNFQGRLMSASGSIVSDGAYSIEFNLYNVSGGGSTQWTETQATVTVKNGYFSANLGSVTPFPSTIDWSQEQWLTMNVNGDGEMTPRLKLTAVPYAFQAGQLAKTNGANKAILEFANPSANRTITLPNASGTVAVSASGAVSLDSAGNITLSALTTNGDLLYHNGTGPTRLGRGANGECLTANATTILWGSCSGAVTTLQSAYTAGTNPHITLNSTQGTLTIQDNVTPIGGDLFVVSSNGGGTKYLSVTASGVSTSGTLTSGGVLTVTSGGASITGGLNNNSGGVTNAGAVSGVSTLSLSGAISGGTTYSGSGDINTTGGAIQTNSTNRVDNSGNLTNIGDITGTGALILKSGGTGALTLNTTAQSGAAVSSAGITIKSGNATGTGASNSGDVTIDSGTSTNGTTGLVYVGTTNASAVNIGRTGVTTTIDGSTSLTGSLNLNTNGVSGVTTLSLSGAISGGTTFSGSGNINTTGGVIQTNSTTRLDNAGALQNITSLSLSGAISGGTTYSGSGNINTTGGVIQTNSTTRLDNAGALQNITSLTLSGAISGGTTVTGSGNFNTTGGALQTNSITRVDNSGNLTNIGDITGTGAVVLKSGGTGSLTLNTNAQSAADTASAGITIKSGDSSGTGVTSNSGGVTIDSGTSTNGTTGIVQIGTSNASGLTLSRSGITTTVGGTLVISGSSASVGTNALAGTLTLYDGSSNTGLFQTTALGSNRTYTLPDSTGTVCLDGNNCGFVQLGPSSVQTDASANPSIFINKTNGSGNILTLQKNGTGVFTIANGGATQISVTSTGAFNVSNSSAATSFFNVDTSGNIIQVGSATGDGTGILLVLDSKTTTDPTGVNGGMYYNSTNNKFRCYENGAWKDCLGSYVRSFIDTTSDAAVDANTTNYWDTAAENNNAYPNIVLSQASGKAVMGIVTMEMTPTGNTDTEITARVERGIGSVPTCGSGTAVGGQPGVFATNTGATKSNTVTFVDTPNTTSTVYYVLCSDNTTVGTNGNITRIRITLQEVENSN